MAHREGSLFVYLFVATLVMVVALVAAVLILKGNNDELLLTNQTLENRLKQEEDLVAKKVKEISDLHTLIAGSDQGWPGDEFFQSKLREIEEVVIDLKKQLDGTTDITYAGLVDPYADCIILLKRLKQAWDEEALKAQTAIAAHDKLRETTEDQLKELDGKNATLKTSLTELERKYEDNDTSLRQRIDEQTQQIQKIQDDCTEQEIQFKKDLAFKDNEKQQLLVRLRRIEERVIKDQTIEDIAPDGQVIDVESRTRTVWVNLGLRKHMRPGLTFRIFQYVGGKKVWKGAIEINRVEDSYSEGRITEEISDLNPIASGDYVTSPFYDPEETPVFVFAGVGVTTPGISREYLERKLESFGARIEKEVKVNTDFLVALKDYEATPEYQTARQLGVTILRERDLVDYLGR